VQAEGVVYDGWDRVHLIDRFDIPPDWRRIRSIDFGYTNPFVCQWWAIDGDGRMYLYREIYHTKRTVKVHAEQINRSSRRRAVRVHGRRPRRRGPGHAPGERHSDHRGEQGDHRRASRPSRSGSRTPGDGKRRLYVFRGLPGRAGRGALRGRAAVLFADEIDLYSWPKGADGKAIKEVQRQAERLAAFPDLLGSRQMRLVAHGGSPGSHGSSHTIVGTLFVRV
jgi:hypothetical protein